MKETAIELNLSDLDGVSGGASYSGFFQSKTGTGLNIRVDWSKETHLE